VELLFAKELSFYDFLGCVSHRYISVTLG